MRTRLLMPMALMAVSAFCFAKSNGAWIEKVPAADKQRTNPYAGQPEAVAAGRNLFADHCAKCHGAMAEGKGSRPSLRSERLRAASDGDLAWLLKNGDVYKGMPRWAALPEPERWQIIAYLRSLNRPTKEGGQ